MTVLPDSLRILYMPPVYAIISFFSYRYFRSYTYYSFVEAGTFVCFNHASKTIWTKISHTHIAYEVKVHPKEYSNLDWQRIKAVTLSAFLYVLNEFEWTRWASDFFEFQGFYWSILLPRLRRTILLIKLWSVKTRKLSQYQFVFNDLINLNVNLLSVLSSFAAGDTVQQR